MATCIVSVVMTMAFSIKLINKKVVDNLLIYLVLNFQSHRTYSLRIMAVRIILSEMLALWIDLKD